MNRKIQLLSTGFVFLLVQLLTPFCQGQDHYGNTDLEFVEGINENTDLNWAKAMLKKGAEVNSAVLLQPPQKGNFSYFLAKKYLFPGTYGRAVEENIYITPLMAASRYGDLDLVKFLIKKGANVDAADTQGKTSLIYALANPKAEEAALYLLKKGADYATLDYAGNTTLHYAVFGSNAEGIHMTLGGGVRMNAADNEGITPLHTAARSGGYTVLDRVLSLGAEVTALDKSGMNALHYAAANINLDNMLLLLAKNLDVNLVNKEGYTPLDIAMYEKNDAVIPAIRKAGGRLNDFHYKELAEAVKAKDVQKVDAYLKEGVYPNRSAETPLIIEAVRGGNPGIVEMLIRFGADVNAADEKGESALDIAIKGMNYPLAISLLSGNLRVKENALLNLVKMQELFSKGTSSAAFYDLAGRLADKPFNLEAKDPESGMTALHFACMGADSPLVKILLGKGSNTRAIDNNGWQAVHFAALRSSQVDANSQISSGMEASVRISIINLLKEKGADLNSLSGENLKAFWTIQAGEIRLPVFYPSSCTALGVAQASWDNQNPLVNYLRSVTPVSVGASSWYAAGKKFLEKAKEPGTDKSSAGKLLLDAENYFRMAIGADGKFYDAWFALVSVYFILGEPDKAISSYEKGKPGKIQADELFHLGCARCQKKDFNGGIRDFTQVLAMEPNRADALLMRGKAYFELKNKTAACADFNAGKQAGDKECAASVELYCK
jgi:ankyrin repeat protein